MPTIRQLFKSMQFQLIFWSVLALLLLAIGAGGYGFWHSYEKINEFQDDNLKSMSAVLEQMLDIGATSTSPVLIANIHFDTDDDDGNITVDVINTTVTKLITYSSSHNNNNEHHNDDNFNDITLEDLPTIPVGISTKTIDDKVWRVYRSDSANKVIIIRQRTEFQDDIAQSSALQSFLPLIIGMAFLILLLPFIMWRMLRPVRQLQREIGQRRESDLDPLAVSNLPTELLPLVSSLNRLLALAKISINRQQRFIADAAHELRSPLTTISLQLQRLQRLSSDDVMTNGLDKLSIRLKRNQRLVEQLLTLARADNISFINNSEHKPVSVKAIVEQVIGLLIPIIDNKNIALTVELLTEDCVNMNETLLLLLVKNLIQNAIVYTPDNNQVMIKLFQLKQNSNDLKALTSNTSSSFGTHVIKSEKINKLSKSLGNKLILQIMDTGTGIDPNDYENVFEPFVRLSQTPKTSDGLSENITEILRSDSADRKNDQIEGTGLGMSIVKSICERADIDVFMNTSTLTSSNCEDNKGLSITLIF